MDSCELKPNWNAYQCTTNDFGMLMFENMDETVIDVSPSSIQMTNQWANFNNTVNPMGSEKEGYKARYPIVLNTREDYTMAISGNNRVSSSMRFHLDLQGTGGTKIKLPYTNGYRSITLTANGNLKLPTDWNDAAGVSNLITKADGCGEYRFVSQSDDDVYLEFFIEQGCTIEIAEVESVMASIRLDWSLTEFYADGGVDNFKTRMALALSIDDS